MRVVGKQFFHIPFYYAALRSSVALLVLSFRFLLFRFLCIFPEDCLVGGCKLNDASFKLVINVFCSISTQALASTGFEQSATYCKRRVMRVVGMLWSHVLCGIAWLHSRTALLTICLWFLWNVYLSAPIQCGTALWISISSMVVSSKLVNALFTGILGFFTIKIFSLQIHGLVCLC